MRKLDLVYEAFEGLQVLESRSRLRAVVPGSSRETRDALRQSVLKLFHTL